MIFTADWHIRGNVPRCRVQTKEEWFTQQKLRVREIVDICNARGENLVIVGDIFDSHSCESRLLSTVIKELLNLQGTVYITPGNHDLRHRNPDLAGTAYGVLHAISARGDTGVADAEDVVDVLPYGETDHRKVKSIHSNVLVMHRMCVQALSGYSSGEVTPTKLMAQFPDYDFIVCGDNHQPFMEGHVINCGPILRQKINEGDEHCVWSITPGGLAERIFLKKDLTPIVEDAYTKSREELDTRFEAFVEVVRNTDITSLSFPDVVEELLSKSDVEKTVESLVREIMEVIRGKASN